MSQNIHHNQRNSTILSGPHRITCRLDHLALISSTGEIQWCRCLHASWHMGLQAAADTWIMVLGRQAQMNCGLALIFLPLDWVVDKFLFCFGSENAVLQRMRTVTYLCIVYIHEQSYMAIWYEHITLGGFQREAFQMHRLWWDHCTQSLCVN